MSKPLKLKVLFAAMALLSSPGYAAKGCEIEAQFGSGAQSVYDPFSPADMILTLTVTARNRSDQACQARFYVAPVGSGLHLLSGASRLTYDLEAPRGGGSRPDERGPFIAHVPANGSQSVEVPIRVRAHQVVAKGDYIGQLELRGIAAGNEPVAISGASMPIRVLVPARVELNISGTRAPPFSDHNLPGTSIDFGEAQAGATERVFVNVWSNGRVAITLSSENHGAMRHLANPALPSLKFSARFDGSQAALEGPFSIRRMPPQDINGASYPLELTLGDVSGRFAGRYKDVITVSVDQN
jgi:hypothetical protein